MNQSISECIQDSEEGAKVKGVGVGKGGAYLLASSTEMLRIRFPFQSLSLRLSDFLCLQEGDYLNDTIIDFYLNHIVEHLLPDEPWVVYTTHYITSGRRSLMISLYSDRRVTVLPSVFWHNLSMRQNSLPDDVESMTEREKVSRKKCSVTRWEERPLPFVVLDWDMHSDRTNSPSGWVWIAILTEGRERGLLLISVVLPIGKRKEEGEGHSPLDGLWLCVERGFKQAVVMFLHQERYWWPYHRL